MPIEASPAETDAARGYEALFVPAVFGHWTAHMLDAAGVSEGDDVLDIACGTGVLARAAKALVGSDGHVTGVDPAPGMLAVAEDTAPEITWRLGTAEALDHPDASVDHVLSQFGMMFFTDRARAAAEMQRVLRPHGRATIAVWDSLAKNPAYHTLGRIFDDTISTDAGDALRIPFSLGTPDLLRTPFDTAGFTDLRVATHQVNATFPSLEAMVNADMYGWLPLFDIHVDADTAAEVMATAKAKLSAYIGLDGAMTFPTSAHILVAQRASD